MNKNYKQIPPMVRNVMGFDKPNEIDLVKQGFWVCLNKIH